MKFSDVSNVQQFERELIGCFFLFRSWSSTPFQMTMVILVNNVEWEITILFLFVCQETMSDAYPTTPLAFTAEKPTKLRE